MKEKRQIEMKRDERKEDLFVEKCFRTLKSAR